MEDRPPLISIIIPTYNQERFIALAIESALSLEYPNKEIIISNDASTDNTHNVINELDCTRFKYYRNNVNIGRVKNYKKCIEDYARGDFITILDGDDFYTDNNWLNYFYKNYKNHESEKPVFFMASKKVNEISDVQYSINDTCICIAGEKFLLGLFSKYTFSHLSTVYNRKMALELDFYREDIISSDMESILRLALKGNVLYSNKVVGVWQETGSNESQVDSIEMYLSNYRWIKNVYKEFRKIDLINAFIWKFKTYYYSSSVINSRLKRSHKFKDVKFVIMNKPLVLFLGIINAVLSRSKK